MQPEKISLTSWDIPAAQREKLKQLFPEVYTEDGKIDFDRLKLTLGETVDTGKERYGMNWPGKTDCFKIIQQPSVGTLLPVREESVNFDTTENMIIEGDNLEVLKLLQKSYLGKIKMIYIDPPYNTGNDFIYPDNYTETLQTYLEYTGQVDSQGRRFGTNSDINGRFHSKWMNMMYPRLFLARALLKEDGVVFISIDDNEAHNLRAICNEVFGEDNFRNEIIIRRGPKSVQAQFATWDKLSNGYESILMYSKNSGYRFNQVKRKLDDSRSGSWNNHWRGTDRPTMRYKLFGIIPENGQWRWSKERSLIAIENYQRMIKKIGKSEKDISQEEIDNWYLSQENFDELDLLRLSSNGKPEHYIPPSDSQLLNNIWFDLSPNSSLILKGLFDQKIFDNPKPIELIKRMFEFGEKSDIILDFFAGSGTTAHAVLDLNKEDGGNRKFILVQLPEPTDRTDFLTIADICEERVRRVINKLNREDEGKLPLGDATPQDRGFKVFKLATSNFKLWNSEPSMNETELTEQLELYIGHILPDRSQEDILTELLLKAGFPLTVKTEKLTLAGKTVFSIAEGAMLICLEHELTPELIKEMAGRKPRRALCLDEGFAGNDQLKTNAALIFEANGVLKFQTV